MVRTDAKIGMLLAMAEYSAIKTVFNRENDRYREQSDFHIDSKFVIVNDQTYNQDTGDLKDY